MQDQKQHNTPDGSISSLIRQLLRHPKFRENNAPSLLVLSVFSLLILSRLIDTALLGREQEYLSIILLQLLIFLIPGLLYCKLQGSDFSSRIPLRMFRPSHILFLFSALLVMVAGCLLISIHTGGIEGSERGFSLYETFTADLSSSAGVVLFQLLAFAALPALCEELVFRGILLTALQQRGSVCAFAFSALYFGMLHFDFAQLPVYMFAGLLLCLVVRITRSLPAAIVVHFLYNIFGLFGQSALARFYSYSGNDTMFRFLLTAALLIGAAIFCGEASRIYQRYAAESLPPPDLREIPRRALPAALVRTLFPAAGVLCIIIYIFVTLFG
ncbi:MAG: CPBP family intramembrane metalloprotease [Clostridia bacterium]|nr:CPBP family intramembrane metalloprotease [Clostridia bacterium]